MKILICSSEVVPFAKTGGLADVSGALPLALEKLGIEVRICLPKYKQISSSHLLAVNRLAGIDLAKIGENIQVYLIRNDAYFKRDGLYGEKTGDYQDNLERFSFYCKRSLDLLKEINFKPDCVHCHDWQSALIPVYLKNSYNKDNFYKGMRTLFTIHNLAYQGLFAKDEYLKLGLDWSLFNPDGLEFFNKINILKGGLVFSDLINTVSPTYAKEIQTKEFGCGLEGVLAKRGKDIFGILNGLDYDIWDPARDRFISKPYSSKNIDDKYVNKASLQNECGLSVKDVPLFGFVGRLAEQKGMDLIAQGLEELIRGPKFQIIALGTGDIKYQNILGGLARNYPCNISAHLKFDDVLAHKIYAACDIFLMPSRYEPCGLGQMIALRYGSIPLVFKTGGLADTISEENGFIFDSYSKSAFVDTMRQAILAYNDKQKWRKLVQKALAYDFSWDASARKYAELYHNLLR